MTTEHKPCYEIKVIEDSRATTYETLVQNRLNAGWKIQWCAVTTDVSDNYPYKAILIKDNEITTVNPK